MRPLTQEQLAERYPNGFRTKMRCIRDRNGSTQVYECRVALPPPVAPKERRPPKKQLLKELGGREFTAQELETAIRELRASAAAKRMPQ